MKFDSLPQPKPKQELKKQAKSAEKVLGKEIYPRDESIDIFDPSSTPILQEKYRTRYDAYVTALRGIRQGEVDTKEIKHAKEWITALNNLDTYIKDHESKDDPLLREKQFIVFKKIRDFLEEGKREGYVKLPTGVGKTILFLKITEALNLKTLIASPSRVILNQNKQETKEFTDSEFGEYHGDEKDLSKKVTHITYDSLVSIVREAKINPDEVPVLILDEAHRSLGPERAQAVRKFHGLKLGFTATSEFSANKKVAKLLEEEIFRMDVAEAIREGLICNTQTIHAYTNVDLSSVDIKSGKFDPEQLEKIVNVQGRNLAAVELYQKKFSHLKAVCHCSGIKHAQDVAKLFNSRGIPAACITKNTPRGDKEGQQSWILKKYKEGSIKVLLGAKILLEGFNEPTCSVTLNLHPTLSLVNAEQRARSGRLDKNNAKKWSYVIDFIDKNAKKPQVLYSEILGGDRVWDITTPEISKGKGEERGPRPPIDLNVSIEGLKVVVDTKKIMEVTNQNLDTREKWTFETLRADVIAKKIKSSKEYLMSSPENGWYAIKKLILMPQFPKNLDGSNDWDVFLGREKFDFKKLRLEVIAKGIKSSSDYQNNVQKNKWPTHIRLTSMPEFPKDADGVNDWDMFLGKEKRKKWTFETLRVDVKTKGIKSSSDYQNNATKNNWPSVRALISKPQFPKNPDGSNDWGTFLRIQKE